MPISDLTLEKLSKNNRTVDVPVDSSGMNRMAVRVSDIAKAAIEARKNEGNLKNWAKKVCQECGVYEDELEYALEMIALLNKKVNTIPQENEPVKGWQKILAGDMVWGYWQNTDGEWVVEQIAMNDLHPGDFWQPIVPGQEEPELPSEVE